MNELTTTSHYLAQLTPYENQIIVANSLKKIKEVNKVDMIARVKDALSKAILVMGSSAKVDYQAMVDELINELKSNFQTFTVEEVCMAIDAGSKGKLGDEYVHVHVRAVLSWIWLWRENFRIQALDKKKKLEAEQEKLNEIKDKERKERDFEAVILGLLKGFPTSLRNENYGYLSAIYRHLDGKGLITHLTKEAKINYFQQALEIKEKDKATAEENDATPLVVYTQKEIAEALAMKDTFEYWHETEFDLKLKLK